MCVDDFINVCLKLVTWITSKLINYINCTLNKHKSGIR